jgi:hypothetical protein
MTKMTTSFLSDWQRAYELSGVEAYLPALGLVVLICLCLYTMGEMRMFLEGRSRRPGRTVKKIAKR